MAAGTQARTLTVIGDNNYPPYLFKDPAGNTVGYIADLWKLWEENTGVPVNLVSTSWGKAQEQILAGNADVIEMIFRTPEREPFYTFSPAYETVRTNIYTLEGITGLSSPGDLSGFAVGVQKGDACIPQLNALGVRTLNLYDGYRQMINDMLAQKIKIFCMDEYPADYYIYLLDSGNQIQKAFSLYSNQFHRAVRKGDTATLALIERGMASISPAQRKMLDEKWKGRPVHELSYPKVLVYGVLGSIVLAGLLALWIALLRVAVKRKTKELQALAFYDSLTQLPNRRLFNECLADVLAQAERDHHRVALLTIDIDQFKEVNDTLGHPMGDELIVQVSKRLRTTLRASDTIARFGGDEFNVLITDQDDISGVSGLIEKVLDALSRPYTLGDEHMYVTASVGVSIYPDDAHTGVEMLRHSDQAMYEAKSDGRNRFRFFTESMQASVMHRLQLARDLRRAIANNEFEDYYQPVVELATGGIHKAEALLRWHHPVHGFISPAEFIPIAEDTGTIVEIGNWMFMRVVDNVQKWLPLVGPELAISVNKSPVQFRDHAQNHLDWVAHLKAMNLPGKHIVAEITEGLLLRQESSVENKLLQYRDAGIQVAIDDFGTGYSSLSYLTRFHIDYLKIDQSFTRNLAEGTQTKALCEAIVMMAHALGLKVIAEGVETAQQRDILQGMGCDYAQGYLYAKPVPAQQFQDMLESCARVAPV
jgi:diguanylate cyclase (GGDEF)-like protein